MTRVSDSRDHVFVQEGHLRALIDLCLDTNDMEGFKFYTEKLLQVQGTGDVVALETPGKSVMERIFAGPKPQPEKRPYRRPEADYSTTVFLGLVKDDYTIVKLFESHVSFSLPESLGPYQSLFDIAVEMSKLEIMERLDLDNDRNLVLLSQNTYRVKSLKFPTTLLIIGAI